MYICGILKVLIFKKKKNYETKNKCKRVTGPWKPTNLCYVHIFHTMKWKYAKLFDRLPFIDSAIFRHGVDKCVCMCLIDDLKLNHDRIWLTLHTKYSLYLYTQNKKYQTKLPKTHMSTIIIQLKYHHAPLAWWSLHIYKCLWCVKGQGLEFKSPRESFTHIYT